MARSPVRRIGAFALASALLAGCASGESGFGFRLQGIEAHLNPGSVDVAVHQKLVLSQEAKDALDHGVALAIETELALRPAGSHRDIRLQHRDFEIHYLPLSKRYQLISMAPFKVSTFPRLRHVLAELGTVRFTLPVESLSAGAFELRARSFLDKRRMPPPMRLPVWFSSRWHHDSGWQSWPFRLTEGV